MSKCCSVQICSLVLPVVLAGAMAYYLYTPLPAGLRQKWKIQSFYAMLKLSGLCISLAEKLGFGSKLNLTRQFQEMYMSAPLGDKNISVTESKFGNVPVMIFRPKTAKEISPAVVYFHGGGFKLLSSALYAGGISDLARWLNVVVVSVDYRLSPENPFPAPFDDAVAATVHVLQNGLKLGIDINNVGIAGDSAGGNLAAAVALRLSDENVSTIPKLKFQIIIYSVLQALDFRLPCYLHNEISLFSNSIMVEIVLSYLGIVPTKENIDICLSNNHVTPALKKSIYASFLDQNLLPPKFRRSVPMLPEKTVNRTFAKMLESFLINPYIFPLMAKDLSKVPPAYVLTCQHDLTRDDALLYAERLRRNGIEVQQKHVTDAVHDFFRRAPNDDFRYEVMIETLDELAVFAKKYFK